MKCSVVTLTACFFATLVTLGCYGDRATVDQAEANTSSANVSIVAGEKPSDEEKQAMLAAKEVLFQKLSGRLMQAMSEQGPAAAIAVCQREAMEIAADVGQSAGLKIGRTGVRLRNRKNRSPEWAKTLTKELADTPQFVKLSNGDAAALLPIKLQSQCLMCHGPTDQIAPVIKDQLAKLYPEDQATGFKVGELRGWFWIEKPSS